MSMGDFNGWNKTSHALRSRAVSGIWEGFIPGVEKGRSTSSACARDTKGTGRTREILLLFTGKRRAVMTASIVWDLDYRWGDGAWMKDRGRRNHAHQPMAIYEVARSVPG